MADQRGAVEPLMMQVTDGVWWPDKTVRACRGTSRLWRSLVEPIAARLFARALQWPSRARCRVCGQALAMGGQVVRTVMLGSCARKPGAHGVAHAVAGSDRPGARRPDVAHVLPGVRAGRAGAGDGGRHARAGGRRGERRARRGAATPRRRPDGRRLRPGQGGRGGRRAARALDGRVPADRRHMGHDGAPGRVDRRDRAAPGRAPRPKPAVARPRRDRHARRRPARRSSAPPWRPTSRCAARCTR